MTGKFPFGEKLKFCAKYRALNNKAEIFWGHHEKNSTKIPQPLKDLLTAMFAHKPTRRPSLNEILYHEWVTDVTSTSDNIWHEFNIRKFRMKAVNGITTSEDQKMLNQIKNEILLKNKIDSE